MSKISITPNASGTGVFTISSPATNTDRTLTLPDEAGTIITTAGVPSSAMPAGSVLQVVSSGTSTATSTSSTSFVASQITVSITPSSATSKILVTASTTGYTPINEDIFYTFFRNNSVELSGNSYGFGGHWIAGQRGVTHSTITYLDSPNTTSATPYTVYIRGVGGQVTAPNIGVGTIIAMEIAG